MQTTQQPVKQGKGHAASEILNDLSNPTKDVAMQAVLVKFNKHHIAKGAIKARVWYALDNRVDGRKVVTIYAKDYGNALGEIFADDYENSTDTMTDYFDTGHVRLFEDHPLYAAARARAESMPHH